MTNQEAIEVIKGEKKSLQENPVLIVNSVLYEAFDTAIKALEQESMTTMVYPQVEGITPTVVLDCDRNICIKNEYNGIGCDECEVTKSQEPSGDLISRTEVFDLFKTFWRCFASHTDEEIFKKEIAELPSVKQEPKTGHWTDKELVNPEYIHQDRKIIVCSECNFGIIQGILGYTNYCPNCGAKMVDPQESEDKENES